MTEKDLFNQLNKLKTIAADTDFKAANRQLLWSQISQGAELQELGFWAHCNLFFSRLFSPYAVAAMIVLFFAVSGAWGWNISQQAKPGDSLYLAKKLSERTKMLMAMGDNSKTKLNLEFAVNRVLEMTQTADDQTQQETLKNDFKKEISQVKDRLAKNGNLPAAPDQKSGFQSADQNKNNVKIEVAVPAKATATSTNNQIDGLGEVLEEAEKLFDSGAYNQAADKLDQANEMIK